MFNFFGVRCVGMEEGPDPDKFTGHGTCTSPIRTVTASLRPIAPRSGAAAPLR
jgi:hypothetical protein